YGYGYGYGYGGNQYGGDYGNGNGNGQYGQATHSRVAELQRRLARAGYYHGSVDGVLGPQTRRAIRAYERDHGYASNWSSLCQLTAKTGGRIVQTFGDWPAEFAGAMGEPPVFDFIRQLCRQTIRAMLPANQVL